MTLTLSELWPIAASLLGVQVTYALWRFKRETSMEARGETMWLPPADYLSFASIVTVAFGVFAGPIAGLGDTGAAVKWFGLAAIFTVGHLVALVGHYQLIGPKSRPRPRSTPQEMWLVGLFVLVAVAYVSWWIGRYLLLG